MEKIRGNASGQLLPRGTQGDKESTRGVNLLSEQGVSIVALEPDLRPSDLILHKLGTLDRTKTGDAENMTPLTDSAESLTC